MSHALAPDARQMCAAMSHVWCYSLNYKPIVCCYEPRFGRRSMPNARCSEPRLAQLSGGQLRLFLGRIPPSLSTLLNPGSFGKFSKYIYFWNLQPYMIFSVRSTLSWPNLFLLEDNCACFLAAFLLPFQLCSTQDRLENSPSIFIFGILNLTCYFPYDPR